VRKTKYTREVLEPIVAISRSYTDVMRRLGLAPTGGNHRMITHRIRLVGLDTSHFVWRRGVNRYDSISADTMRELVRTSTSFAHVLLRLGLPQKGRPHSELKAHLRRVGADTSDFTGPGWSRGKTKRTHASIMNGVRKRTWSDDEVFVENSPLAKGPPLVARLRDRGWQYRCAWCGIVEWRERPLVLHLDHINGINNDNRLENLRLLCPNCHSQTDTYCNRAREQASCYTSRLRERVVIGSRDGFRCRWMQIRGGSSPPARTNQAAEMAAVFFSGVGRVASAVPLRIELMLTMAESTSGSVVTSHRVREPMRPAR
jgi:hypothetical protein